MDLLDVTISIEGASNIEQLQLNAPAVAAARDAKLAALYQERLTEFQSKMVLVPAQGGAAAPVQPAGTILSLEATCLALIENCRDGDELRSEVVERLRPLVASSTSLLDKCARQLSTRYVSITGAKGLWTTRQVAKELRDEPKPTPSPTSLMELTHVGVAQRILAVNGGNLRTIVEQATTSWLHWSGVRWVRLSAKQVGTLVNEHIDALKRAMLADPELATQDARIVVKTLGHNSFNAGVVGAMGHQRIAHVSQDELNQYPEYLAVSNGAVHLPTGRLVADRDLLLTVQSSTAYRPEATCPTFENAVRSTFEERPEDIEYYELLIGYSLLATPSERAVFFHCGEGNNGKSLLLGAITHALGGEHAPVLNFRLIASEPGASTNGDANAASPAQFKLRDARLGFIDELPKGGAMRDAALKQFAGGGRIDARQLHEGLVEFDMTAVIHVNCNVQVAIRGAQRSTWHRVCPVAYRATFKDDPELPGKLRNEAEGILAWAVRCAQKYLRLKADKMALRDKMPASAREELEAMKKAQDPLAEWLEDCCEMEPLGGMSSVEGWSAFLAYHESRKSELPQSVRSDRLWFERMTSIPGVRDAKGNLVMVSKDGADRRTRGFYGIQLKKGGWSTKAQLSLERPGRMAKAEGKREATSQAQ